MRKTNLILKSKPTLKDFQRYIAQVLKERGFDKETFPEMFMLLIEECGEMAKAVRRMQNIKTDKKSEKFHLEHEVADVFFLLLDICNHFDVDLEKSFRDKEEINKKRIWN